MKVPAFRMCLSASVWWGYNPPCVIHRGRVQSALSIEVGMERFGGMVAKVKGEGCR